MIYNISLKDVKALKDYLNTTVLMSLYICKNIYEIINSNYLDKFKIEEIKHVIDTSFSIDFYAIILMVNDYIRCIKYDEPYDTTRLERLSNKISFLESHLKIPEINETSGVVIGICADRCLKAYVKICRIIKTDDDYETKLHMINKIFNSAPLGLLIETAYSF